MSEPSDDLHRHISNAYGMPDHLKEAFQAWVASVEARLHVAAGHVAAVPDENHIATVLSRLAAVETAVADLHAALSSSPSPATVQRAVADVEMPGAEDAKD